jgi:hypothetical protein
MEDCDVEQQFPIDWNAPSSPSKRMARPFWTMTLTPHSIFPHPRQQVFTSTVSRPDASLYVLSANTLRSGVPNAASAAPVMAAVVTNVRRVMLALLELLDFSTYPPSCFLVSAFTSVVTVLGVNSPPPEG